MDEIENEEIREQEIQPSSGPIEDILPTTNEDEMKKLMQELDREQSRTGLRSIEVIIQDEKTDLPSAGTDSASCSRPGRNGGKPGCRRERNAGRNAGRRTHRRRRRGG